MIKIPDYGELGKFSKTTKIIDPNQEKVLEKMSRISKEQWREMRPVFDTLKEIADAGGIKDFLTQTFDFFKDSVLETFLLPFAPLFEIITPAFAETMESVLDEWIPKMEALSTQITEFLSMEIGGKTIGDWLNRALGFIGDVITGRFQKQMAEWGKNFAEDLNKTLTFFFDRQVRDKLWDKGDVFSQGETEYGNVGDLDLMERLATSGTYKKITF